MTPLRALVVLILLQSRLLADGQVEIQKTVDSWRWTESVPEIVSVESKGALVISIAYKKPFIVDDTDSYGISLRSLKKNTFGGSWGRGKSRCGPNGGCSGVPRIEGISRDGFRVVFDLRWSNKDKGEGTFKEGFDCKWTPEQSFMKDGFAINVTVTKQK